MTCTSHIDHAVVPAAVTITHFSMPNVCKLSICRGCMLQLPNLWSWVSFPSVHTPQTQRHALLKCTRQKLIMSMVCCMTKQMTEGTSLDLRDKEQSAQIVSRESQSAEQMKKKTLRWANLRSQELTALVKRVRSESLQRQTWTLCRTNLMAVSWWMIQSV